MIAVFFHGLFFKGDQFCQNCFNVIHEQMQILQESGLMDLADEIHVGINGGEESIPFAETLFPENSVKVYHGLNCRNELRTLMHLQKTMQDRKGWYVLYFHTKGAFHDPGEELINSWRGCMMYNLVTRWTDCVNYLSKGYDSVGCHWLIGQADGTQNIWAGNFWWARSDFIATLPPIQNNSRIPMMGGVDSERSRFEAEVWLGGGPKLPRVKDFHPVHPCKCGRT